MAESPLVPFFELNQRYPNGQTNMTQPNPNTNILEGTRCPECGNTEEFRIEALVTCTVTDDSAEVNGELTWTEESWCQCPKCEHEGKLGEFREPEEN